MNVENGPRKPKWPRPKRPKWKKKQDQNGASQHPKRPILMSKTAHYVTLYKYRINDVIKCTWGIPYKRVDAAAVVAAHLSIRRACVSTGLPTWRWRPMLTSCAGNTKPVHRSSDTLTSSWTKTEADFTLWLMIKFVWDLRGKCCVAILHTVLPFTDLNLEQLS